MGVKFTDEQNRAIYARNRNLLVSAAAGSGKTAVLVERIIQMIIDTKDPIDIDKILVVTFTNAAASEMKMRISDAIEKKLEENPSDKYLHRQLVLLSNANIMTIHAFCLKIIKNHFNVIGLDPSYRIGDENELFLLKKDVLKDLLEDKYEEGKQEFLDFIESFGGSKTDDVIEDLILNLHRFSLSNPWPNLWLNKQIESLNIQDERDLVKTEYYKILIKITEESILESVKLLNKAKAISIEENGPLHYKETVETYIEQLNKIKNTLNKGYEKIKQAFDDFEPIRLSAKRKGFDPILKEKAKNLIDAAKGKIIGIKELYFQYSLKEIVEDIQGSYTMVKVLGELTKDFSKSYQKAKEEKNIIDFNDIEHYALNILVDNCDSGHKPSEIADIYMNLFHEILIDEYQDSNLVQETILTAVSKERIGKPNIFMVGDVKQSIYKFRLAKPELFMEKYVSYSEEDSLYQRINLYKNFRSRPEVINSINFFFKQVMTKELGDVTYDEKAALHLGANYEFLDESNNDTEIIIVNQSEEDSEFDMELSQRQLEAKAIAQKINKLVNGEEKIMVFDKPTNEYRRIRYNDIVILLRTTSGWTDEFIEALSHENIPAYSNTTTGYFETLEIMTIMNMLRIIDNPIQDIPLVSVLRSPIVGLSSEELVQIRMAFNGEMFDAINNYLKGSSEDDALSIKLKVFLDKLKYFQEISKYMSMDELIYKIFEKTNFYHYTILMPNGVQRKANLDMFVDKAVAYEQTSYRGVFDFIRYIENIHKYDIDIGEATVFSEKDNLVRIMSIHKSKGLEFPIVFVAGLGKQFNKQDLRQAIVYHQDLGIGADYVNFEERFRVSTLPKNIIKDKINKEILSEELRILYVALTRAKEKLILVGSINKLENKVLKWYESLSDNNEIISGNYLNSASSYLDWLMGAFIRHPDGRDLRNMIDKEYNLNIPISFLDEKSHIMIHLLSKDELGILLDNKCKKNIELLSILNKWKEEPLDKEHITFKKLNWIYPFNSLTHSKLQMSVSEIKRRDTEYEDYFIANKNIKPKFIEQIEGITATEIGTAYHKVLFHLNFIVQPEPSIIKKILIDLKSKEIITKKEIENINENLIINFLKSNVCKRMISAADTLKKEVPFVIGIRENDIYNNKLHVNEGSDIIMIQGVIDAFFEENGEIVLVDYKTDFIKEGQESLLINRYKEQLDYYKKAIEQITNKKVKESIIYSISLSKEIIV